jgi:hypothetical protein
MRRGAPCAVVLLAMNRDQFLGRAELLQRYNVSIQQLNGWLARAVNPLPAPELRDGQPYWRIFSIVAWERAVRATRRAQAAAE